MARKTTTSAAPKAAASNVDKAAPAAASATAEQLVTQPAASTEQPVSAAPGLEAGTKGPDAPTVLIVGGLAVGDYIAALKAGGIDVIPLAELPESLLRLVGQFVEIGQYDVLPPEQLVLQIEQKFGLEPTPYPPGVSGGEDPLAAALNALQGGNGSDTPVIDAAAAGVLAAGADNAMDDDGDIEGLWVTAVPEQGFRRCGFRFTREGTGIALSALTEQQIEQLESEPNLKVERGIFGGRVGVQ
jgi:hypothetical protein